MDIIAIAGSFLLGGLAGSLVVWMVLQERFRKPFQESQVQKAGLEAQVKALSEQVAFTKSTETRLQDSFKALSWEVSQKSQEQFMQLAKATFGQFEQKTEHRFGVAETNLQHWLGPIKEHMGGLKEQLQLLEKTRHGAYVGLSEQVKQLLNAHSKLETETVQLSKALRNPSVCGMWGEMQLRRVVELAGMLEYVDFIEQPSLNSKEAEQGMQRPDMVIQMPGSAKVVLDAKTPITAYLEALELTGEAAQSKLKEHARLLRGHIQQLGQKRYWRQFEKAPEFVILFLPAEALFSTALQNDPLLIEYAATFNVVLATPTTLMALLKTIAYGWRQEGALQEVQKAVQLVREFYERFGILTKHLEDMRKGLDKAVESYNKSMRSLQTRVFPSVRKIGELNLGFTEDLIHPEALIETVPVSGVEES